jgi:DNA processing protein
MDIDTEQAVYLATLASLSGVTTRLVRDIINIYPDPDRLISAAQGGLLPPPLERKVAHVLTANLPDPWHIQWHQAETFVRQHQERGMMLVPLTSGDYPPLLRTIPDPPLILYGRGHHEVLRSPDAVAIVGTRRPTERGREVAHRIASHFASAGFVVVSGLARGIDAHAHLGALAAGGRTLAVLPGALDAIYPPEHAELAGRIADEGGLLVSEYPLGVGMQKRGFVLRDRIQAGLSAGVIPIQTTRAGGTMHTVRFAERYHRPLFCPQPLAGEESALQYSAIHDLISSGRAQAFQQEAYSVVVEALRGAREVLLKGT